MATPETTLSLCVCGYLNCTIPLGYCHCKCGEKTGIAEKAYIRWGKKKGDFFKYARGHHGDGAALPREPKYQGFIDGIPVIYIPMPRGASSIIDAEDESRVEGLWYDHKGYAARTITLPSGKRRRILMQHLILGHISGLELDHINGNRRDNRKINLRFATEAQNGKNRGINCNNTSGVSGVGWRKDLGVWESRIGVNWIRINLGHFKLFEDAVAARKQAEQEYYKEFARRAA